MKFDARDWHPRLVPPAIGRIQAAQHVTRHSRRSFPMEVAAAGFFIASAAGLILGLLL